MTIEEQSKRLEQISKLLESDDILLADAMKLFEEGVQIIDSCTKQLNEYKTKTIDMIEQVNSKQE